MNEIIYRVQDADGRGPWKPGFSHRWADAWAVGDRRAGLKPWPAEFGFGILRGVTKGQSVGCGCLTMDQIWRWFSRAEMDRLHALGYQLVKLAADRILAASDIQVVFVRNLPLNEGAEVIE